MNIPDACIGLVHRVSRTHNTMIVYFTTFLPPHYVLQEKEEIKKWTKGLPRLNESQIRHTDQCEQTCKQSFQCRFCIC